MGVVGASRLPRMVVRTHLELLSLHQPLQLPSHQLHLLRIRLSIAATDATLHRSARTCDPLPAPKVRPQCRDHVVCLVADRRSSALRARSTLHEEGCILCPGKRVRQIEHSVPEEECAQGDGIQVGRNSILRIRNFPRAVARTKACQARPLSGDRLRRPLRALVATGRAETSPSRAR
jgi:hypothetical protein